MWIISLILIVVFFALSSFFSGMETGLISIDRLKMEQKAKTNEKAKASFEFLGKSEQTFWNYSFRKQYIYCNCFVALPYF